MRRRATLLTALAVAGCAAPTSRPPAVPGVPAIVVPSVAPTGEPPLPRPLADLIATSPKLSGFRALAAAGDLPALLTGRGAVVVLAPTDDALARLAPGTIAALLLPGNRPSLRHLLQFWAVPAADWSTAMTRLAAGDRAATVPTLDDEALAMRDMTGGSARPFPTGLYDAAGHGAAIGQRPTTEGGALVMLDRVLAPRSIAPGEGYTGH